MVAREHGEIVSNGAIVGDVAIGGVDDGRKDGESVNVSILVWHGSYSWSSADGTDAGSAEVRLDLGNESQVGAAEISRGHIFAVARKVSRAAFTRCGAFTSLAVARG